MRNTTIPLNAKFLSVVLVAVLVPLALMANLLVTQANANGVRNLESYMTARGELQVQAIENNFNQALLTIERFLINPDAIAVLREPLLTDENSENTTSTELRSIFRETLIPTGFYNSLWLLTPERDVLAVTRSPNALNDIVPLARQSPEFTEVFETSQALAQRGQDQIITLINGEDTIHIVSITLLEDPNAASAETAVLGYFVAELNLNEFVQPVLDNEVGTLTAYSFLVYPDNDTFLLTRGFDADVVDLSSLAVQSAFTNNARAVDTYFVGDETSRREVIGYYEPFRLADNTFVLVTELSSDSTIAALSRGLQIQIVPFLALLSLIIVFSVLLLNRMVVPPLAELVVATQAVVRGDFDLPLNGLDRQDEIGNLTKSFAEMRQEINHLTQTTNRRLENRTRDVQIIQTISESIINETDLDDLLDHVVELVVDNFPSIYHAQIFLLDQEGTAAVLRASTGERGRALLRRGHRLAVGSVSVIGQVTEQGQITTARDTAESNLHRTNEFLPETRAELAIPLQLNGRVVGALDVQSKQRDSFDDDQIEALKTLADQITIAIENVRLYAEYRRLVSTTEARRRTTMRQSWREVMRDERKTGLSHTAGNETGYDFTALREEASQIRKAAIGKPTTRNTIPFVVPIELQGELLGMVEYEIPKLSFTHDKVALAEELVNRLAISLENARLLQDNQQVATRESVVNTVSARLTGQTDINTVLEIALEEISRVLRTPQVAIKMQASPPVNGNHSRAELPVSDSTQDTPSS